MKALEKERRLESFLSFFHVGGEFRFLCVRLSQAVENEGEKEEKERRGEKKNGGTPSRSKRR